MVSSWVSAQLRDLLNSPLLALECFLERVGVLHSIQYASQ